MVGWVLRMLVEEPGDPLDGHVIFDRSRLQGRAPRALLRVRAAGWVGHDDAVVGVRSSAHPWRLTDTGIWLARERLDRRAKNELG